MQGSHGYKTAISTNLIDIEKEHKFGYILLDTKGEVQKVVRRTNPNDKWDWHKVGGRWTGMFKLKAGKKGSLGSPGLMTKPADGMLGYADVAKKGDIDWEFMRDEREDVVTLRWRKVQGLLKPFPGTKGWTQCRVEQLALRGLKDTDDFGNQHMLAVDEAREIYHNQPGIKALNRVKDGDIQGLMFGGLDEYLGDLQTLIKDERANVGVTHAILFNGVWYEHGEMGMWGAMHGSKDNATWQEEFASIMSKVPDDALLTAVDCHI